jgi:MOSC domain-containing protein YiiM
MVTGLEVCDLLEHRSGLNARILQGGRITPGDEIAPV